MFLFVTGTEKIVGTERKSYPIKRQKSIHMTLFELNQFTIFGSIFLLRWT